MSSGKPSFLPDARLPFELLQRRKYRRLQEQEERGFVRQWFLICGPAGEEARLSPQPGGLHKLFPPPDRAWADPFLWDRDDQTFIFCEEWLRSEPHGHLAALQVSTDGRLVSGSRVVLRKNHHLSYPFLFEHEGELCMMPEGGAGRVIEVYGCEEFPLRWTRKITLMSGIDYADATLFAFQAKWWLFMTVRRGLFSLNRDLFLFWADSPLTNQWTPHPANPVIRSFQSARPAGRVFESGGRLFRPSQNSLVRYGHSLRINEIVRLDSRHYEERLVSEVKPDWEPGIRANHHIDWRSGLLVMDAQRLIPA